MHEGTKFSVNHPINHNQVGFKIYEVHVEVGINRLTHLALGGGEPEKTFMVAGQHPLDKSRTKNAHIVKNDEPSRRRQVWREAA